MNQIYKAINILKNQGICAAATETVYGLFADASSDIAIQKVYQTKGRPSCNPLICHVSSIEMAENIAELSEEAKELAKHFWIKLQKPLTLVVKKKKSAKISDLVTAGLDTIAIRRPNHETALLLIEKFNAPLAAPSANKSMSVSPTSFDMVREDIGDKIDCIIDSGECSVGIESTILDLTSNPYAILRAGGTIKEEIEDFLKKPVVFYKREDSLIKAPGMMKRHYAPSVPLRMNASFPLEGEAFVAFGRTKIKCDANLSEKGDLHEAARNLFKVIKKLDRLGIYKGIAVMPIPNTGIGIALNDRIFRASESE